MASTTLPESLWFLDAIQAPIILIGAFNAGDRPPSHLSNQRCSFHCVGASFIASPLTIPMMVDASIPAKYQAYQWSLFLHGAEHIFPPLNAIQTLANVILSVLVYRASGSNDGLSAKFPKLVLAAICNIGTTAFVLGYMAPLNNRMRACGAELAKEEKGSDVEKKYRVLQRKWTRGNNIRAVLMVGAAVAGMWALLTKN